MKTGEITVATRSVEIDGVKVESGQVIALLDGKLVLSAPSVEEGVLGLLEKAEAAGMNWSRCSTARTSAMPRPTGSPTQIRGKYPNLEIEVQEGGQPHYQFIISVE